MITLYRQMNYKGKEINPYESFYWNTTERFFGGSIGGGISRCVKTDDSLAVMIEYKFYQYPRGANKGGILKTEICPTISTSSWENNCFLVEMEEKRIIPAGYVNEGKHQQDFVQHQDGISRAICCGTHGSGPHLTKTLVSVPAEDTSTTICLNSKVDGKQPSLEHRIYDCNGVSVAVTCSFMPSITEPMRYRIRKLTPRECFRLMDMKETDIDKIQSAGISNSQQYKLAGNSIVVANLYHLFRKMFIEKENECDQLTIF